ncbi:MAG: electron transport complex subunit RsxE [bacterium]
MAKLSTFTNGLLKENAVLVLLIGLCPTLAVSTTAMDALGMGVATAFVLVCSNICISAVRKLVPPQIRIPIFIIIISTFVTIADYFMNAYAPTLHKSLGLFIPLIVVNCIILGRAEAFASKKDLFSAALDGLGTGIGYVGAIGLIGSMREILGNGSLFGYKLTSGLFSPAIIMILPPGGFIVFGFIIAFLNHFTKKEAC